MHLRRRQICLCGGGRDIGVDYAAGGSYAALINNLIVGGASIAGELGPYCYRFPLFIPAGTQIGFAGQTSDTSGTNTLTCRMWLSGRPKYPELTRAGSYVTTFGANTANSQGVAITPGNSGAKGTYVDISGATTLEYWFWEYGLQFNDLIFVPGQAYRNDLAIGDASNKQLVILDHYMPTNSNEAINKPPIPIPPIFETAIGSRVYVRSACTGTTDSNCNVCVYGVGG